MAISPTMKAKIKAIKLLVLKILGERISLASNKIAPAVTGIKSEKEKLRALIGDNPKSIAEKMVRPERETPGKIATAWKIPMINAGK